MTTNIPRYDFHIHTKYLGCGNATMEVSAIAKECERLGVTKLGITDHLNSLDKLPLHIPIKQDIERLDTPLDVYFGVELNFLACDGSFPFSADIKEQYGFQFVIGGIHGTYMDYYDLKQIVDIQHRHHLKTCSDPLVDVLVHPYNTLVNEFNKEDWPPFSMDAVPKQYARELGQAAHDTGTAIEIHWRCIAQLGEAYTAYLEILAAEGASFSLSSDAHDVNKLKNVESTWRVASELGLTPDRIWVPEEQPLNEVCV